MKLQDQVCLLEQGRRLKELGITGYPLFTHVENFAVPNDCHIKLTTQTQSWKRHRRIEDGGVIKYFPAFTVAELGVMLPAGIQQLGFKMLIERKKCWSQCVNLDKTIGEGWIYCLEAWQTNAEGERIHPFLLLCSINEAQLCANALIWLLEHRHVTAAEVNARLAA